MPIDRLDVVPIIVDQTLTYYIPFGFTFHIEVWYYEDSRLYFRLEEPHYDLEFLLTPIEYDEQDNVCGYNMELVHPGGGYRGLRRQLRHVVRGDQGVPNTSEAIGAYA